MNSTPSSRVPTEAIVEVEIPTAEEIAAIEAEGTRHRSRRALAQAIAGIVALLVGSGVTLATYLSAKAGAQGVVVVWYGPMLFGAFLFVVGFASFLYERWGSRKKRELEQLYGIRR